MSPEISLLVLTTSAVAFFHVLLGPDHYLPIVMMAKSRQWRFARILKFVFLCGLGHLLAAFVLGAVGVSLGLTINKIAWLESIRGQGAAWALMAFGLVYFAYSLRRRARDSQGHGFFLQQAPKTLFMIFMLGPCEPLIPLLMYPAVKGNMWGAVLVIGIFSSVTLLTMVTATAVLSCGARYVVKETFGRYAHALTGGVIFFSGAGMKFLGW